MNLILGTPFEEDELRAGAMREDDDRIFIFIESKLKQQRIGFRGEISYHLEDPDRFDYNIRQMCDKAGLPTFSRKREEIRRAAREAMNMPVG